MCLLQIACRDFIALIDPLAVKDLSSLKPVLENEQILLIIHNASFEKRILKMYDIYIDNIYDTLRVSRDLRGRKTSNNEKIRHGLGYVCKRELSLAMNKDQQVSDWARRPLGNEQLMYAALDAEVMLQLYDHFMAEKDKQLRLF